MDLFTLVAKLGLDTSEYEKGITSALKSMQSIAGATQGVESSVGKMGRAIEDAMGDTSQSTKNATTSIKDIADEAEKSGEKTEKAIKDVGTETEKTTNQSKSLWSKLFSSVKSEGESAFGAISAKTIAFGNLISRAVEGAARKLIDFGKSAIQSSADVEAEIALYEQVFGELEVAANGALESISKDTNILSTRLRGVGTSAFMQFKGAGVDAASALAAMDKYTRLAADAAAAYNISIEDADVRLRSFLRGNTEAGDSIGLFTSESQRNERAIAAYGQKWTALTEAQKQMLMLNVVDEIYKQQDIIGQAAREGHEWENVIGNLNNAFVNLKATIGGPFREALIPVVEKFTEFLSDDTVNMRIGMLAAWLGEVAGKTFDGAIEFLDELLKWSNGESDNETIDASIGMIQAISGIAGETFQGAIEFLKWLLGGMGEETNTNVQEFLNDFNTLVNSEGFKTAAVVIGGIVTAWMALHHPLILVGLALAAIVTHWEDIKAGCKNAWDTIKAFCREKFVDPISEILSAIGSGFETIIRKANDAADALAKFFGIKRSDYNPEQDVNDYFAPGVGGGEYDKGWGNDYYTGRAVGLDYVPYNDYLARLHEGEAVLTKAEATSWRRGESGTVAIDYTTMGRAVGEAVRAALEGIGLYTDDGTRIADMVTQRVSRNISRNARNRRYQPV